MLRKARQQLLVHTREEAVPLPRVRMWSLKPTVQFYESAALQSLSRVWAGITQLLLARGALGGSHQSHRPCVCTQPLTCCFQSQGPSEVMHVPLHRAAGEAGPGGKGPRAGAAVQSAPSDKLAGTCGHSECDTLARVCYQINSEPPFMKRRPYFQSWLNVVQRYL